MSDVKTKYPSTSSTGLTLTLTGLATDSSLLAGRASTAVDNTTNVDLDHLVSGLITVGTSPTASTNIEVWAYAPYLTASGTPTYPDSITGTDSNKTMTSLGIKYAALRPVCSILVDATTSNRGYYFYPTSIASLFGSMPKFWGIFIVHNTGATLNSTGGNHSIQYERVQAQTV